MRALSPVPIETRAVKLAIDVGRLDESCQRKAAGSMLNVRGEFDYEPSGDEDVEALQAGVAEHGIRVTILEVH